MSDQSPTVAPEGQSWAPLRILAWIGGANPSTLAMVPGEWPVFVVNGLAVSTIPFLAGLGMTIRVESMTDLSYLQAGLTAGILTFLVIFVLDLAIVRTLKHPAKIQRQHEELIAERVGQKTVDASIVVRDWRRAWPRRIFLDIARIVLSLSIGVVTSHALVEWLYADDIEDLKETQLAVEEVDEFETLTGEFSTRFGDWITDPKNEAITLDAAWQLTNGSQAAPSIDDGGDDPLAAQLLSEISQGEALVEQLFEQLTIAEADLQNEIARGANDRLPGRGPVAIALENLANAKRDEYEAAQKAVADNRDELRQRQQLLLTQAEANLETISEDQKVVNRQNVIDAWDEYAAAVEMNELEHEFDPTELGVAERTTLFFDAVFPVGDDTNESTSALADLSEVEASEDGFLAEFFDRITGSTQLIALSFFIGIIGLDLTPFALKRLFSRQHDTIQMLLDASVVPSVGQLPYVKSQIKYVGDVTNAMLDIPLPEAASHNPEPVENEPDVTPDGLAEEPPVEEDRLELIGNVAWSVDRVAPIQNPDRRNAGLYKVHRKGNDDPMVLKEPVPEGARNHAESVRALKREIKVYGLLHRSPYLPQFHEIGINQDQIVLDYFERRSLDYYLFGRAGVRSRGNEAPIKDVTVDEIVAWQLHLLRGLRDVWDRGFVMIDGHPSNTLVQGLNSQSTFTGDPLDSQPYSPGFLKLVDPGSALEMEVSTRDIRGRPVYQPPEYRTALEKNDNEVVPTVEGDIYSYLGGIGYFVTTGSDVRLNAVGEAIAPDLLNPSVPAPLSKFVLECLDPDPRVRIFGKDDISTSEPLNNPNEKAQHVDERLKVLVRQLKNDTAMKNKVLKQGEPPLVLAASE